MFQVLCRKVMDLLHVDKSKEANKPTTNSELLYHKVKCAYSKVELSTSVLCLPSSLSQTHKVSTV